MPIASHTPTRTPTPARRPILQRNRPNSLQRQPTHQFRPPHHDLCPNRRLDQRQHLFIVINIDRYRDTVEDGESFFKRFVVSGDDYDWVDVAFEQWEGESEDFSGCE